MDEPLSPKLLDILQHSLGLDQYGFYQGERQGYRNHFSSGPGCDHYVLCRELVDVGLMVEHSPRSGRSFSTFVVTEAGRLVVREQSPKPPKLSRSQKRYRAWLRAECGLSFGDWIRLPEVARG